MDDAATFGRYLFWIILFVVAVAYFAGFVADTKAASGALNSLINTGMGKNAAGNFSPYPTNAPAAATGTTAVL